MYANWLPVFLEGLIVVVLAFGFGFYELHKLKQYKKEKAEREAQEGPPGGAQQEAREEPSGDPIADAKSEAAKTAPTP